MRAAVITQPGGPEVIRIQEIEEPAPGPEEVLVDIKASALNRADLAQRRGRYPSPPGVRADVPGLEMAGVVAAVGERVTTIEVGQRVFALLPGGGYAERVVIHERMAMPIPDNMTFMQATAVPEVFFTAYDALFNLAGLSMGESVLIHAAGSGVGTAAVQLAHRAGATVFGTTGSGVKLARAASLGMDVGINYREERFAQVIAEHTDGRGVDVVLDMVGAPYWEQNLHCLATLGRMVMVGLLGSGRLEATDLGPIMFKRLRIYGTVLRARTLEEKIALTQQFIKHVLPMLAKGLVHPVVDRLFPLEDVAAAHAYMESNRNFGKIVLTME